MACDISGCGCKICPGIWIAGVLLLVMTIQNLFFRAPTVPSESELNSVVQKVVDPN